MRIVDRAMITTLAALTLSSGALAAPVETVLYRFTSADDGANALAVLISYHQGALYDTTEIGGTGSVGTVLKLTPPAKGQTAWTESVLYSFKGGSDGATPIAGLIADNSGALYGTTAGGGSGNNGTVFKLTPPAKGQTAWTETVLHSFKGGSGGATPIAGLIADNSGALYGTTAGGGSGNNGTVFKLTPPTKGQTAWTETVLYSFKGGSGGATPIAGLIADNSGALYGTTAGGGSGNNGTVFKLTPPTKGQTAWTETVLYSFKGGSGGATPIAGLIADNSGALYGTTAGGGSGNNGTVFKLTPPTEGQTAWSETVLYSFKGGSGGATPIAGLIADNSGALYGTTAGGGSGNNGTVFKLTPPAEGQTAWTETVLYSFKGGSGGASPRRDRMRFLAKFLPRAFVAVPVLFAGNNLALAQSPIIGFTQSATPFNTSVGAVSMPVGATGALNSAFGNQSLSRLSTGSNNSAFGFESMLALTSGGQNSAFGTYSMGGNTITGGYNNAFGIHSLYGLTSGNYNQAFGTFALQSLTNGQFNIGIGHAALAAVTTSNANIAIGHAAGWELTTGSRNVAIGYLALSHSLVGANNIAIGDMAMFNYADGGAYNGNSIAIGTNALIDMTTGSENVAIGTSALGVATSAVMSNAVGVQALQAATTPIGFDNAFGTSSLGGLTTGNYNTAIGHGAGYATGVIGSGQTNALTTANYSTFVGFQAGPGTTTQNDFTTVLGAAAAAVPFANSVTLGRIGADIVYEGVSVVGAANATPTYYTVSGLPACSSQLNGARSFVTDATAPTFLGTLRGGGTVTAPVFCNGTSWVPG